MKVVMIFFNTKLVQKIKKTENFELYIYKSVDVMYIILGRLVLFVRLWL